MRWLFLTLPPPGERAGPTGGGLKKDLVTVMAQRVRRLIRHADSLPFAQVTSAKGATWLQEPPTGFRLPVPLDAAAVQRELKLVLQGGLVSLTGWISPSDAVRQAAQ